MCQASRVWQLTLTAALIDIGFEQCKSDTCLFYHPTHLCFITIHVDDLLILCDDPKFRAHVIKEIESRFKLKDLGTVSVYLGMNFAFPEPGVATINQRSYIDKMVARFGLGMAKPKNLPLPSGIMLTKADMPTTERDKLSMANYPYRALIGSLMYAARGTRPEISFAVSQLSKFNQNPGQTHWKAANTVLRYLKGSSDLGLLYRHEATQKEICVEIMSDSDWGQNPDDRKSNSGFVVLVNGNPISWLSRAQKSVAMSSCEAEFMALSEAMREALWLANYLPSWTWVTSHLSLSTAIINPQFGLLKTPCNTKYRNTSTYAT
jgi:hypothetical protein